MSSSTEARPVDATERVQEIDIVRGFALLGIFIMNLPVMASSPYAGGDGSHAFPQLWDRTAEVVREVLFSGKFNSMFSLLFGVGFTIQLARLEAKLGSRGLVVYARRLVVLLAFGLIHALGFWFGDVLHIYAVLGLLLLFLRRASDRVIFALIGACMLFPTVYGTYRTLTVTPEEVKRMIDTTLAMVASNDAALGHGTFVDALREHVHEFSVSYGVFWRWSLSFYVQMLATLLLGYVIGRRKILQNVGEHLPLIRKVQWIGLGVGVLLGIVFGAIMATDKAPMEPSVLHVIQGTAYTWCRPCIMLFYVATILRASQVPVWQRRFAPIAAVGRMALTNYLLQTLLGTTLFFSWGFGLWNKVGPAANLAIPIAIFVIVQIPLSVVWLKHFEFGPMEWLWRALTYGHAPAMRRAAPGAEARATS